MLYVSAAVLYVIRGGSWRAGEAFLNFNILQKCINKDVIQLDFRLGLCETKKKLRFLVCLNLLAISDPNGSFEDQRTNLRRWIEF